MQLKGFTLDVAARSSWVAAVLVAGSARACPPARSLGAAAPEGGVTARRWSEEKTERPPRTWCEAAWTVTAWTRCPRAVDAFSPRIHTGTHVHPGSALCAPSRRRREAVGEAWLPRHGGGVRELAAVSR